MPNQAGRLEVIVIRLAGFADVGCWPAGQAWPAAWQHLLVEPPQFVRQLPHPQTWSESRHHKQAE